MWPGFGENCRVLDWILRRVEGDNTISTETPIGLVPTTDSLNLSDMTEEVDQEKLFHISKDFWRNEVSDLISNFNPVNLFYLQRKSFVEQDQFPAH